MPKKVSNKLVVNDQARKKMAMNRGDIVIYKDPHGNVELNADINRETIWATLNQIATLFGRDKSVISRHIKDIYKANELSKISTVAKNATVQIEGNRSVKRNIELYNLDVIISVGYRVNSKKATQFRIWATKILKGYLVEGYAINEKRLTEIKDKFNQLQSTIKFLEEKSHASSLVGQEGEILNLLASYSKTLSLLNEYDKNQIKDAKKGKSLFVLTFEICTQVIDQIKKSLSEKAEAGEFFGNQIGGKFDSVVKNLYQTFGGKELYGSLEEKAANLLYLIIKDHPFSDGNKRIGSFMFVYFLDKNNYLYKNTGEKKINDNALTALALLVAESNPKEKDLLVALITQLIK